MKLKLNGIEVDCIIGERPDERIRRQRVSIDVELTISAEAADSDRLEDTVDYAMLTERIRSALILSKCKMIERAAKIVYDICISEEKVNSAVIAIRKAGAIANLESAEVVYDGR